MDDREVLQHLLSLENEASALVNDAQAEADRRTAERENQNRLRYDETYAGEVEALEKDFAQNLAIVRENCRQQLEAYRAELESMSFNVGSFLSLAEKFMLSGGK
jgi:vacuolar-type H+-ATPase subunit H